MAIKTLCTCAIPEGISNHTAHMKNSIVVIVCRNCGYVVPLNDRGMK